jgi:hypothetical protein
MISLLFSCPDFGLHSGKERPILTIFVDYNYVQCLRKLKKNIPTVEERSALGLRAVV